MVSPIRYLNDHGVGLRVNMYELAVPSERREITLVFPKPPEVAVPQLASFSERLITPIVVNRDRGFQPRRLVKPGSRHFSVAFPQNEIAKAR
jgi:hypothetical protein